MVKLRGYLVPFAAAAMGFVVGFQPGERIDRVAAKSPSSTEALAKSASDQSMASVLTVVNEKNDLKQIAALASLVGSLDEKQWSSLLDQAEGFPEESRERLLPRLLEIWTRFDRKAATNWIRPRLDLFPKDYRTPMRLEWRQWKLIDAWASNAPEEAMEYARTLGAHNETQNGLIMSATSNRTDKDYAKGFELLREFPSADQRLFSGITSVWAEKDRDAALAAATSLPAGPQRQQAIGGVLTVWASKDPARALEIAANESVTDSVTLARILQQAAKSNPSQAAAWLENQGEDGSFKAQTLAVTWAQHDPAAALAWAQAHGVSIGAPLNRSMVEGMFNNTGESPLQSANRKDPAATLAFVEAMPPGEDRTRCLQLLIPTMTDIEKAKSLVAELSPEAASAIVPSVARVLYYRDKEKAVAWAATLSGEARQGAWMQIGGASQRYSNEPIDLPPAGPDRDAMISGIASSSAIFRPDVSLNKATEISDPELRQRTLHYIIAEISRSGGEDRKRIARQWLETASVPAEWKQKWNP